MKVIIERQLFDAKYVVEQVHEVGNFDILKRWKPDLAENPTDEELKDLFESLGFQVLDV